MKYIGFIKEYDNFEYSQSLTKIKKSINISEVNDEIIDYLNKGKLVFGWMGYFTDLENNDLIAPMCYYTDGFWVWPSYFPYFLKKYGNTNLPKEFLTHLINNEYKIKEIGKETITSMENELSKLLKDGNGTD